MKPESTGFPSGVEIHLIGFGEQQPPCFDHTHRYRMQIDQPVTPLFLLQRVGFPDPTGLLLMRKDTVIPEDRWQEALITRGDQITLMSAIEGG